MNSGDFDIVEFIINFKSGKLSEADIVEGFQHMINKGLIFGLRDDYKDMAIELIKDGWCKSSGIWSPIEARNNYLESN